MREEGDSSLSLAQSRFQQLQLLLLRYMPILTERERERLRRRPTNVPARKIPLPKVNRVICFQDDDIFLPS